MVAAPIFRYSRLLALWFLVVAALPALAQIDNVYVYGTVKDYNTSKKLDAVTVTVYKDGSKTNSVVTSANGKYEFNLDYGYTYKIVYEKPGMVGKNVEIDTKGIPDEERVGGLAMNVEMTLFQDIPGIDYTILQQPIGKSKYDGGQGMLSWDLAYTEQMRAELNRLQKEYDEKKKREANADVAFQKLMDQGNAAMGAKDFKKAVQSFTDALGLKPDDPVATARLSDAQMMLGELEKAAQSEKQYTDLIKEADGLFNKKSYEEAKGKYAAALDIKEGEKYPKQRIKECDAFIADLAAKAEQERKAKELDEKYNAAVAAGDAAFKAVQLDEARAKYNEAASLKPAEKYPPQQLAAIAAKEQELAKKAEEERKAKEQEEAYQAAIQAGDAAFNKADYEVAKTKYNEALDLKPKEKYPTGQLAAIAKKLEELAKQAAEEERNRELEANYQAAIAAADAAFQAEDYDAAKKKYNDALGIKPKEKYPADQLTAIAKALADKAKKEEADRLAAERDARFQDFMDKGEAFFGKDQYAEAKAQFQEALKVKPDEARPKERIVEIEARLEQMAKDAEARRKQEALDAQYAALIASADKKFKAAKHSEAINDYKDASALKPEEQYPKDQIAAITNLLDAQALEQAEKERLAREQADRDSQYAALISQGDKDFKGKEYEAAATSYTAALELKPDEKYPAKRLDEIGKLLEAQLAAQRDRDAKDAAERERLEEEARKKAEADSLKAAREAEERARLEAERRAVADVESTYNDAILKADAAFKNKAWDLAKEGYNEALAVKPGEKYPKKQLAAVDKAMADQMKADERASAKAEADRLAEEERLRREAGEEAARQAALEEARREREALRALDERYGNTILEADNAMADKDYSYARELYSQALDIKPGETYPQVKIDQIDKLVADLEQQQRKREQAARKAPEKAATSRSANFESRKEQDAEEFMREAREREEAEKYQRILALKDTVREMHELQEDKALTRHGQVEQRNAEYVRTGAGLYQGSEALGERNREELEAFREERARRERELMEKDRQASESTRAQLQDQEADIRQRQISLDGQRENRTGTERDRLQEWQDHMAGRAATAQERTEQAREQALGDAQYGEQAEERNMSASERRLQEVERAKLNREARQRQMEAAARDRQQGKVEVLGEIPLDHQRSYDKYARNELAAQYPQGVTEESTTEGNGNTVIIRRILVQGNKADDYQKVINKWGTFYFKNGQSISEYIWTVSTER